MVADKSDDTLVCNSWCPVNNWSESSTVLFIAASAILLISDDRTQICTLWLVGTTVYVWLQNTNVLYTVDIWLQTELALMLQLTHVYTTQLYVWSSLVLIPECKSDSFVPVECVKLPNLAYSMLFQGGVYMF